MAASSGIIPNFINGVSQQPAAVRLPTQLESQVNGYSTITEGLRKRPMSVHQAILTGFPTSSAKYHTINRDETERYKVGITDRDIDIVDLAGAAKTVNFADATFTSLSTIQMSALSLTAAAAVGNGSSVLIALPEGHTVMQVVTTGANTNTVLVQESILGDFTDATTVATITSATTTSVTVVSGRSYRCRMSAWTSGSRTATMFWPAPYLGYDSIGRAVVVQAGAAATMDVVTTGTFTGRSLRVQESILGDFTDATTAATISTATTTAVSITSGRYYRVIVYTWTGVVLDTMTATMTWKDASYINTATPETDLDVITVADYTFILNKTVTCAALTTKSPKRNPEALVHIVSGNYNNMYKVKVNGTIVAEYNSAGAPDDETKVERSVSIIPTVIAKTLAWGATSPDGWTSTSETYHGGYVASTIGTTGIVSYLSQTLTPAAGWLLTRYNNIIHIENVHGTDFTISVEGNNSSTGDGAIRVHKGTQVEFSELPNSAPDGFTLRVVGDKSSDFDDYYVQFFADSTGSERGLWKESVAPDTLIGIDPQTMAHTLTREADGTFTFQKLTWDDRAVGDVDLTPWPSFIGKLATSIAFFRNRLGFAADENIALSRSGSFYNHWPASVTVQLDTDPIDVAISHPKVSIIHNAVTYNENLLLFSGLTQFRLTGDSILTPKTTHIEALTEYRTDTSITPVVCGDSVFFVVNDALSSTMREFLYDADNGVKDGPSITDHCSRFLPPNLSQIACNEHLNMLAVTTTDYPSRIYIYKFYWSNKEKLQSCWSYWDMGTGATVHDVAFIDNDLSLVVTRSSVTSVEAIPCEEGYRDSTPDLVIHLDRRLVMADMSSAYDAGDDQTTFTLPYAALGAIAVTTAGALLPTVTDATVYLVVAGDQTASTGFIGFEYEARYRLTEFVAKETSRGKYADAQQLPAGSLTIRHLTITTARSSYFTAEVGQTYRDTYTYTFTGALVGTADDILGSPSFDWRSVRIPIMCRANEMVLELVNDSYLPFSLLNAEWQGDIHRRR